MRAKREPSAVARVYDRVAGIYDLYTSPMEVMGGREARERLFRRVRGRVLELGIGTGASLTSYPDDVDLIGVDISPRMLERARRRAVKLGRRVELEVADIEHLPYPDDSFDTVTASCVFCSVADPVRAKHVGSPVPVVSSCCTSMSGRPTRCSGGSLTWPVR